MQTPFPPPGYEEIPSKIPGITVFKKQEVLKEHKEVVAFKCPNCGADKAYSAENGGLTCTHCNYFEAPIQSEVSGKQSEEFEFTVETLERAAQGWGTERKEMVCNNCGGHTVLAPESMAQSCPFCHSNNVIQQKAPQDVLRPRFLIPLKVTEAMVKADVDVWLGDSSLLPDDLKQLVNELKFVPMFIPFWTFDAHADAAWEAEVGRTVTTDEGTETHWSWESGRVNHFFDDLLAIGSKQLDERLLKHVKWFNLEELVPYQPSYLAGMHAQAYEIPLQSAWQQARNGMRKIMRDRCYKEPSGRQIRNFCMNLDFHDESWRYILVPYWLGTYTYEGKSYQVIINGQNRKIVGKRPANWKKVHRRALTFILPGLLISLVSLLPIFNHPDVLKIGTIVGIGAFIIGGIAAAFTYQKASKLERP